MTQGPYSTVGVLFAVARTTLAEAMRDRIMYSILLFGAGLIVLSGALSNLTLGYRFRIVTDISLSSITFAGISMAVLLGSNSISREVERRTVLPILAKPLHRWLWVLGKYIGILSTAALNILAMACCATLVLLLFRDPNAPIYSWTAYAGTLGLNIVRVGVVAAVAVLFSTFVSSTVAVIATIGFAIAGYLAGELRFLLENQHDALAAASEIIFYIVPDLAAIDTLSLLLHSHPIGAPSVLFATAYAVCYILFALFAAGWIFSRRDLT
jgi:ABC-type transport system involved in multi-copper enzyme maturation permease subunit